MSKERVWVYTAFRAGTILLKHNLHAAVYHTTFLGEPVAFFIILIKENIHPRVGPQPLL